MDTKVAGNLKRLREERSLTQEALADSLGVSAITVYKWEAGRLPVEYKMLVKIAEFYDVPVDTFTADETEEKAAKPITDKMPSTCKVCGGDLIHNYLEGTCRCANCGNKWSISELYPDYSKYAGVIATITKANAILNSRTELASADEANLLYKQAIIECTRLNDAVYSDLVKICYEGQVKADRLEAYCRGKHFFENRSFSSASESPSQSVNASEKRSSLQIKSRMVSGVMYSYPNSILYSIADLTMFDTLIDTCIMNPPQPAFETENPVLSPGPLPWSFW